MHKDLLVIKFKKESKYLLFLCDLSVLNFTISKYLLLYIFDYYTVDRYFFGYYFGKNQKNIVLYNIKDNVFLKINLYNPYFYYLVNF
jgi:hypothetical protein